MAEIHDYKERERDVRRNKVAGLEGMADKHLETVGEGENKDKEKDDVGRVRLQDGFVRTGIVNALVLQRLSPADVCAENREPCKEAGNG